MRALPWLLVVIGAAGCTHSVHQVSLATAEDLPSASVVHRIEANTEQNVTLGITDNTDFVDQAYSELLAQCPEGQVVGIEARHSTSHNFLHYENRFKLTGLCLKEARTARAARTARVEGSAER